MDRVVGPADLRGGWPGWVGVGVPLGNVGAVGLRLRCGGGLLPDRGDGIRHSIDPLTPQPRDVECRARGTIRAGGVGVSGIACPIPKELVALGYLTATAV